MKDNAALVWAAFQSAAIRWRGVRADPALPPPMRDALDLADAVQELLMRGDLATIAKLKTIADKALARARVSRELDPELRERKRLMRDVTRLLAENASPEDVVHRIAMWPDLNVLATPDERPVRGRRGRLTTQEELASAVVAVRRLGGSKGAAAVIELTLVKLDVPRDRARTIANVRRK